MDINSRINWKPGMEMTAETFAGMGQQIDFQQQVAIQAALGNTRIGILPSAPFNNRGVFVKSTFEIERFQCLALLPSGKIINADERIAVDIPLLDDGRYYLTVGFGEELTEFEKDGVPYLRPQYVYQLHTLEEIEKKDLLPIARFSVSENIISVDTDFIPPTIQIVCDERLGAFVQRYAERLEGLASHANMADGLGKRAVLHYLFVLKSYNLQTLTSDFIQFTQEIAQAINYYIISPNTETEQVEEIPAASQYDVETWLTWLEHYMERAASVLDQVVLVDHTIDFDELKAQIKAELYEQMTPELHDKLLTEVKEELRTELEQHLMDVLTSYIEQTLKPALHDQLKDELTYDLYQRLYDSLYAALYSALFVPSEPKEDNSYMPQI